ncbi:cysteine hydrolase family protein [Fusibacter ferrireducens]|uniref:Cysteine hydrolase n=1 Tax=Fusibacter ferrireducens TaxID=2785058 RepID=A0ABR9ZYM0_9FIRM|nr:isochorismatase family cysteine hydrolase [Fusibacter ferrireducens]MBF4695560.1 cysteine hydrolase [Fusibacter ferrireducens]
MDNNKVLDEFVANYYGALIDSVYKEPVDITPTETALIIIDAQKCITKEYFVKGYEAMGIDVEPMMTALNQLEENTNRALFNIEKILNKCREKGIRPFHVKIESYLPGAEDTGRLHASAGMFYPPNTMTTEFCDEVKPLDGEIILKKTCSGIHVGTPIDRILRNLHVKNVIVVGFYTDQCVSTSVRDLSDLGYAVDLIEDAMTAMSEERHIKALQGIQKIYANSETTQELLARLENIES